MAEDAVNQAAKLGNLSEKKCVTKNLKIHGYKKDSAEKSDLDVYGADASEIKNLIAENAELNEKLHPDLPYRKAEIVWFCRNEMAQTVEDILARRTRALVSECPCRHRNRAANRRPDGQRIKNRICRRLANGKSRQFL